jgi:stage V sporulation protein B
MKWRGFESIYITKIQGVFNTQYNQLINLPVAISTAVAAVIIPSIIRFVVQNRPAEMKQKINTAIKINMAIAIPSAIGLMVMAKPIIELLFPKLVTYHNLASQLLITGSSAVVFYSLSTITTAILQGNNYMKLPVVHSAFSLFIHIVLVTGLLAFTDLGIYALIIGNILFPLLICILNCIEISRKLGFRWDFRHMFIFPLISSMIMGIVAYVSYYIIFRIIDVNWFSVFFAVTVAGTIYFLLILKFKCFSDEEINTFPFGEKLLKLIILKNHNKKQ